ncbi:MAG: 50S ribosomal protein L6 [Proteobacteria bacterium]|nr:50S ribosomal protein L6 [Pseudomonadota bacterium]
MSRVAKRPVPLPQGVTATISPTGVTLKGAKGTLSVSLAKGISVVEEAKELKVVFDAAAGTAALAGSTRAHLANMVNGVTVGYPLGFSHAVVVDIPEGITIEAPTQTEVLIKGIDRQRVGQIAAEIRSIRPPEPYKGKGVKYSDEKIVIKEGKKK